MVTLVVTVLEIQGERLVVVLRDGVFDPMLCVSVAVVCKDREITGVEDDRGLDVVVFEEERDAVCVMVTLLVRVPTVRVADVEPVLDDVALGKREVVAEPDMVAESVSPVAEGEEEAETGEPVCLGEADLREETDALLVRVGVRVPRMVTVSEAVEVIVFVNGLEDSVGVSVDVFDDVMLRVPVGHAVDVREPCWLFVVVGVRRILGEAVDVAVSVFELARLELRVELAVGVLLCGAERVNEGDAEAVLVEATVRVPVRLATRVTDALLVRVEHGLAEDVLEVAIVRVRLGEAEDVLDPFCDAELVGEEEDVFEFVPEEDCVLVDVIVFEDVVEPVTVCDRYEVIDCIGVAVEDFVRRELAVIAGVFTDVLERMIDCVGKKDRAAVFVPVVVRVDVFDWVDVDVSRTPLKNSSRCSA
jgi:hypothetical protein